MNDEFMEKLVEIRALLAEAYEHALAEDGHCKSGEGAISIHFPPFFWREGWDSPPSIEIYSYVLGPNRNHYFDNIDEALFNVCQWHGAEMGQPFDRVAFVGSDLKARWLV